MAILIDGIKNVDQREMARLSAEMEIYTQAGVCKSAIGGVINFFLKLFGKSYTPKSMSYLAKSREEELILNSGQIRECFYENIKKELKKAGNNGRYEDEEAFSFAILRTVTALHGKRNFNHMSPGELADELVLRARKTKPNKLTSMPVIWLIVSIIMMIVAVKVVLDLDFYYYLPQNLYRMFFVVFVVIELIYSLYIRKRLALTKLNMVVALLGTAYDGTFGVNQNNGALVALADDKKASLARGMRAFHTLSRNINELNAKKIELELEIKKNDNLISHNVADIQRLSTSGDELTLVQKKQQELMQKNEMIASANMQRRNTITGIENGMRIRYEYMRKLLGKIKPEIRVAFIDRYKMFSFNEDFFSHLLSDFEWEALSLVEKRLLEMEATNNLMALGKKSKRGYCFSFPNGQAEGSIIYNPNSSPVKIDGIISGRAPSDVNMSDDQVESVLREYGILAEDGSMKKTISDIALKLDAAKEDISRLENENADITVEKKSLELERDALKNNIQDANDNISKLEKEKRELEEQLKNVQYEDAAEIARITEIIKRLDQQIIYITKEKEQLEREHSDLTSRYNQLNSEYERNKAKTEEKIRELNEDKKGLEEEIKEKEAEKEKLTKEKKEKESEILSLENSKAITEGLLKKANDKIKHLESSGGNPDEIAEYKKTIKKLETQNNKYKKDIDKANKTIKDNTEQITKLEEEKSKLNNDLDMASEEIQGMEEKVTQLNEENNNLKSQLDKAQVYKGAENRKLILDAIKGAQKEIDMSVPWISYIVGREDKDKSDEELIESIENALGRGVRIKLRYGIGEENKTSYTEIKGMLEPPRDKDNQSNRTLYYVWQYHKKARKTEGKLISLKVNDHTKLMIVDNEYYIMGSLNYLSFLYGEKGTDKRGELMIKDFNSEVIKTLYEKFFKFESSKPSWE